MRKFIRPTRARILLALLVVGALFISGCVTSSPYKSDPAHPVRTVSISKDVPMPKKMLFSGFSEMMAGALGGVVGVLATIFREGEDFKLPETLRADLAAEIEKTGKFKVLSSGAADAEVRIRVREYGFVQAGFMRRQVKPILTIETQMIRGDGTMVWQSGVVINQTTKGTPAVLPEQLRDNPKVAADAFGVAARIWATKTAASLR
jgi:hypothetical protein